MKFERPIVDEIMAAMERKLPLLQVLVGPRQVGKPNAARRSDGRWTSGFISAVTPEQRPWSKRKPCGSAM